YLSCPHSVVVFLSARVRAERRPTPAHVDMALFFGAAALIIVATTIISTTQLTRPVWFVDAISVLLVSLPYLLLRLVRDFSHVPTLLLRATELGLVLSVAAIVLLPPPIPALPAL